MRTRKSTFMTVAFAVMAVAVVAFCATLLGAPNVKASGSEFADLKIVGAQLRLDEGNEEMRFVAEMSADEFASLSEQSNGYSLGILVAETDSLHGAALEYPAGGGTSSITVYDLTPSDKIEYKVGQTTTYRFNAKLSGNITSAAKKYTARAFVKDDSGAIIKYSNECVRSASEVAGEYIGDSALAAADKTKAKEFVVAAYNEKNPSATVADFDALKTAIATAGLKIDGKALNADSLFVGGDGSVKYLSDGAAAAGKLSSALDGVARVNYGAENERNKEQIRVPSERDPVVTGNVISFTTRGKVKITGSACGGEITLDGSLSVIDETALTMGKNLNENYIEGNAIDFLNGFTKLSPNAYGAFNWWNNNGNAEYIADNGESDIVSKATDRVKKGKVIKFAYNNGNNAATYVQSKIEYTKEQIDGLLGLGYVNLVCPVYMEVADDANGLKSAVFNGNSRDWLDLYTPNSNITNQDVAMGYTNGANVGVINRSRIYANEWTYAEIPLRVIADNYTQFTEIKTNGAAGYENRRWSLFGIDTTVSGGKTLNIDGGFHRTLYFGDFYVEKSSVDTTPEQDGKTYIDFSDPAVRSDAKALVGTVNGSTATYQKYYVGFENKDLSVDSQEVKSLNGGRWLMYYNFRADYSSYDCINQPKYEKYTRFYMDSIGYSKDELSEMTDKNLNFDVCIKRIGGTASAQLAIQKMVSMKTDGTTNALTSVAYPQNVDEYKCTVQIPVSQLYEHYDRYFENTDITRRAIVAVSVGDTATAAGYAMFIGNMYIG